MYTISVFLNTEQMESHCIMRQLGFFAPHCVFKIFNGVSVEFFLLQSQI